MKRNRLFQTTNIRKFGIFTDGLWGLFSIALAVLITGCGKSVKPPSVAWVQLPILAKQHPSMRQINDIDRQLLVLENQLRQSGLVVMPKLPEIKVDIVPLPALSMPADIKVFSTDIDKVTELEMIAAREQLMRKYNRQMKTFSDAAVDEMDAMIEAERKRLMNELLNTEIIIAKRNRIPVRSTELNKDTAERIRIMSNKAEIVTAATLEKEKAWNKYQEEMANAITDTKKLIADISAKFNDEMVKKVRAFKQNSDKELAAELDELRKQRMQEMTDNRLISPPYLPRALPVPPEVIMGDSGDAKDAANAQSKNDKNRNAKVISQTQANVITLLKRRKEIELLIKKDTEQAVKTLGELHGFNIRYSGVDNTKDITTTATGWLNKYWGK